MLTKLKRCEIKTKIEIIEEENFIHITANEVVNINGSD